MPGGRTAHSRFKIPLDPNDSTECNISKQSVVAELLRKATFFISDEALMAKGWATENVNKCLQDIMGTKETLVEKLSYLVEISGRYYQLYQRVQFTKQSLQVW